MDIEKEQGEIQANMPQSCEDLLIEFRQNPERQPSEYHFIDFVKQNDQEVARITGPVRGKRRKAQMAAQIDHYNATVLAAGEKNILIARGEPRSTEYNSCVSAWEIEGLKCTPLSDVPVFPNSQDPFVCELEDGKKVLGMVEIEVNEGQVTNWQTVFRECADGLDSVGEIFARSGDKMKDIRFVQRPNGKIAVFTRPQGEKYGDGQIGYIEIDSLAQLQEAVSNPDNSQIIGTFAPGEWGGVNDLLLLQDGRILVIGHIARHVSQENGPDKKDYYAVAAIF